MVYEATIYNCLEGKTGVPKIYFKGQEGDFTALVMDKLGPNLDDLFHYCKCKFTIKTTAMIAD